MKISHRMICILAVIIAFIRAQLMEESTVVTGLYIFNNPQKGDNFYTDKVKIFLEYIENPIVFFSTRDIIDQLKMIRSEKIVYIELEFSQFTALKRYSYEFWSKQQQNTNGRYSNTEIGIIWYQKKEFVKQVIQINPFKTNVFIWIDAGSFRRLDWLDPDKFGPLRHFKLDKGIMAFGQVNNPKVYDETYGILVNPTQYVAGAIYSGDIEAWEKFYGKYDEILEIFIKAQASAASDQDIIGTMSLWYPDIAKVYDHEKLFGLSVPNNWWPMLWTLQGSYLKIKGLPVYDGEVNYIYKECNCITSGNNCKLIDQNEKIQENYNQNMIDWKQNILKDLEKGNKIENASQLYEECIKMNNEYIQ